MNNNLLIRHFHLDVEPVLRLLLFQIDRIRRYCFLRSAKEEISVDMVAPVPSFVDPTRSMDLSQILIR